MKPFCRYPHVKDLILHYANFFAAEKILTQVDGGVSTHEEAKAFSLFIWQMVDQMHDDAEANNRVLGSLDNSDMLQDVYYEVSSFMAECGFESVWEKVCDEA